MKRLDYLDKTKGMLIILMVVGHVFNYGYFGSVVYSFHMPAFFAISGMLLKYTNTCSRPYGQVVRSRLYSFGIPFLIYEATGPLTDIMLNGVTLNIKGYIYNTLTMSLNNRSMWFLIALFCVEIIFVGLYKLIKNDNALLIAAVILFVLSFFIPKLNGYLDQLRLALRYYLFFAFGYRFGNGFTKPNTAAAILSAAAALILSAVFGRDADLGTVPGVCVFVLRALLGTYAILQLGRANLRGVLNRGLAYIGRNTMVIYGTHHLYYIFIGMLLGIRDFSHTPIFGGMIILLAVAVMEIPTIYIINRWLPFLAGKHYKKKVKA